MSDAPWDKVDAALGALPLMSQPGWDSLTPTQQWFVAMEVVEGQVFNGGFHAVYYNDCAEYLPLALAGYEAIGATAQAEIVCSVLQTMRDDPWAGPPNTWPDPDAEDSPPGSKDIGEFDEPWEKLDTSVWDLKAKYVDEHREEFRRRG